MKSKRQLSPITRVESLILTVRSHKVILGSDLAAIYGVRTKALNQAVKRNIDRFPPDFMFQLSREEVEKVVRSRSQIVTLKRGKNIKYPPYAFTEHGAIMAATVLSSPRAVQVSVFVVRAFVRLREIALAHRELSTKLHELEQKVGQHDSQIRSIIDAIRRLMAPPEKPKRRMGFRVEEPRTRYLVKRKK